jgi:hypothetical protein
MSARNVAALPLLLKHLFAQGPCVVRSLGAELFVGGVEFYEVFLNLALYTRSRAGVSVF